MTTHWGRYLQHWELLGPPLRPHADVINRVRALIGDDASCLLLGSTVEYGAAFRRIVAVDANFAMVAGLWKHGDPARLGLQSDWARMPIRPNAVTHVVGDGSLNAIPFGVLPAVLQEVTRVLQPQGTLIARVFCRPERAETAEDIRRDVADVNVGSFHVLKWRVAMSLLRAPEATDLAVTDIRDAVNSQFPDRDALCRLTGWPRAEIDTLDVYRGSSAIYNFPTEAMIAGLLRQSFADVEIMRCGSYPLAERCPLLVARRPRQRD